MDEKEEKQEEVHCLLKKEMRACGEECTFRELKELCGWNADERERRKTLALQKDADGLCRLHIGKAQ